MKKLAILNFLLISVFSIQKGFAQVPTIVNDPINYAQLTEMVAQAQDQIAIANESLTFAEKVEARVAKVSGLIKATQLAIDVIDRGVYTVDRIDALLTTMQSMDGLTPQYLAMLSRRCAQAVNAVIGSMKLIENVLGGFNMSDNERLQQLQENLDAINLAAAQIYMLDLKTRRLNRKMELLGGR